MNLRSMVLGAVSGLILGAAAQAQAGVMGRWREPAGSVIEVHACGSAVCARLIGLKNSPVLTDAHNPDVSLHSRPLCGLEIGQGFTLRDPAHAEDGTLYDPKTGKTYKGSMQLDGDKLKLRGYVGIKAFGRSETWARAGTDADLGLCRR